MECPSPHSHLHYSLNTQGRGGCLCSRAIFLIYWDIQQVLFTTITASGNDDPLASDCPGRCWDCLPWAPAALVPAWRTAYAIVQQNTWAHTSDGEGALVLDLFYKKKKRREKLNFACIFVLDLFLFGLGRLCSTLTKLGLNPLKLNSQYDLCVETRVKSH